MKINITSIYVNDQEKALRFYTEVPAARAYQEAMLGQNKPAVMFNVDDVQKEYDRIKPLGAEFTMPPMKVTGSTIAMLNDTCCNLVQLVALEKWTG